MKKLVEKLRNSTPQHIFVCAPKETFLCWRISLVQSQGSAPAPKRRWFFLKDYFIKLHPFFIRTCAI